MGRWQSRAPEEGGGAGGRGLPRSPPRLPPSSCPWMLLFLALWALVPCLVLVTLYFLSSIGGKSGGNKKNDGVKVSPPEPARACPASVSGRRAQLSGLG